MDTDLAVRIAAFNWLSEKVNSLGDVLPRALLEEGFTFGDQQVPLISPQGIFKPRILELPLSITTSPKGPYNDIYTENGLLNYSYRGTDPNHRDNVGLRKLYEAKRPLVYFYGLVPGRYLPVWPVYIVDDNPAHLSFKVAVDDVASVNLESESVSMVAEGSEARRAYLTASIKVRLHQRSFRERVLQAYRSQCAFCRLRHRELLDAAHIIPDIVSESAPTVNNGIALCKLHHAAFDSFIIGVSPDYIIHVRHDVLTEEDGPMLQHGLKNLHDTKLILPPSRSHWPSQEALEWRFDRFVHAG
ncbi:MAG: HNH endonuclease [Nitrososphaera sp.]|nr:HNH endonuclease [Nitrososphaera sp.]